MEWNITPNIEGSQEQNFRFCIPKKLFFLTETKEYYADVMTLTYVRYRPIGRRNLAFRERHHTRTGPQTTAGFVWITANFGPKDETRAEEMLRN